MLLGFGSLSLLSAFEKLYDEVGGFAVYVICPLIGFMILAIIVVSAEAIYNMYKKNLTIITEEELDLSLVDEKEKL